MEIVSVFLFVGTCVASGIRTLIRSLFQPLNRFRIWILSLIRSLFQPLNQFRIRILSLIRSLFQPLKRFRIWILSLIRSLIPIFIQFHILDRLSFSWSGAILGLRYKVECYGQGKIHEDILKQMDITKCGEDPGIPYILFVYKISRDIEDLRNALQWVQMNRRIQREDICTMILLEKDSTKQEKPIEVDHQGVFDEKTVVVRILWGEQWSGAKVQKGPRYQNAMEKVIQSIRVREHN